jgi:hypothetical protein
MKRMVLLILVLFLIMNFAGGDCLGKAKFNLPDSSISVTSSDHPDLDQTDFRHELASTDLPGSPRPDNAQPVIFCVTPTLQIIRCCHLNSSGGVPL